MCHLIFVMGMFCTPLIWAQTLTVQVEPGVNLYAETFDSNAQTAVLMLHQCNRDQRMWAPLVSRFAKHKVATMSVDFRGYGRSKSFRFNVDGTDQDYLNATQYVKQDVHKIYNTWKKNTPNARKRVVIGASCGGGAAGILATFYPEIDALVLLSPSMRDYWFPQGNWETLEKRTDLPVLAIASKQDNNAIIAVERVTDKSEALNTEYIRYNGRLHGQPLFEHDHNLADKIVDWVLRVTQ